MGDSFSWAFAVDVAPKGARRQQKTKAGFATKAEALAAMARLQTQKEDGTYIEPRNLLVATYLEQWLGTIRSNIRPSTWSSYELIMRCHVIPELGGVPLQQLSRNQVRSLYEKVGNGRSPKTVHNVHLALRKALGDAVEGGLARSNPAEHAHKLPTDRPEMQTWSAAELRQFLNRTRDENLPLWRLAANTGMRRGELLGLRWTDVDLEAGRLSVRQQLVRHGSIGSQGAAFGSPKTKAGRRSISLDIGTVAALRVHKQRQSAQRLLLGPVYEGDLVFAREDGSPRDPGTVTKQFRLACHRAGVKRIRLHDLRHTHATLLLEAGIHPKVVQERLGHSSVMVTLDRYSHVVPNMQDEAAARIGAVVDG